jgi:hypothetical protein
MNSLAVAAYFTKRADPQRGESWAPDDDSKVETWIRSAHGCGMQGLILHDGCPPAFRARWPQVEWSGIGWKTDWSTNDERFPQYLALMLKRIDVEWWLFTDVSDVEFFRDPFELMTDPGALYIQTETSTMGENRWMQAHWIASYGRRWPSDDAPIYNAGLFGGHRDVVLPFVERVISELAQIHARWVGDADHRTKVEKLWKKRGVNGNMSALNKATRRWLQETAEAGHPDANMPALQNATRTWLERTDQKWNEHGTHADMPAATSAAAGCRVVTGPPLHTKFKGFETKESGCYVRHK